MGRPRTRIVVCLLAVAVVATAAVPGAASGATAETTDATTLGEGAIGGASSPAQDADWAVPNETTEQPGDVVRIPVEFPDNRTTATVSIANERLGYRLVVEVADENGDGVVVLRWNTYHAGAVPADAVANRTVAVDGPDRVVSARRTTPRRDSRLGDGRYDVRVRHDDRVVAEGVVLLEADALRRSSITVLEGPPLANPSAAFVRSGISDVVERDEWLFVLVERQSIHGYVDGIEDLTGNGTDGVTFRITPTAGGDPVDLSDAVFLRFPEHDEFAVGVPPNATVLEPETSYVARFAVHRSNPYAGGGNVSSTTRFRLLPAGSQPDRPVLEVVDVQAPETVIEGRNATFEVAVVNSGEREGTARIVVTMEGTNVTREVTVGPRSQRTVPVTFDTSPLTEGTTRWTVGIAGGARTVSGDLAVRLTNETPNTEPTLVPGPRRGDDGGQPGFGVLAALAGLALGVAGRVRAERRG